MLPLVCGSAFDTWKASSRDSGIRAGERRSRAGMAGASSKYRTSQALWRSSGVSKTVSYGLTETGEAAGRPPAATQSTIAERNERNCGPAAVAWASRPCVARPSWPRLASSRLIHLGRSARAGCPRHAAVLHGVVAISAYSVASFGSTGLTSYGPSCRKNVAAKPRRGLNSR